MPCREDRKTEDVSHKVKRKTEQEEKEKKIRTKTERKGKKTKKGRRELVQRACTNRLASLSPPSKSHISPKKRKQEFSHWDYNHSGLTPSKPLIPMTGFFLGDYLH